MNDIVKSEVRRLVGERNVDRRSFVITSLSAGFAMAVMPVSAQTIGTSAAGLVAGEVKVPAQGGDMAAYRAMPATGGDFPAVLVVHEAVGMQEHIKDICRGIAKAGYFAIAPELFARQGDPSKHTDIPKLASEVIKKAPDAQVMGDLDACVAYAKTTGKAEVARLGITGFGWGGRIVLMYAAHNPNVKAAVTWYGTTTQAFAEGDRTPLDMAPQIRGAVLGLYGGTDSEIPVETVDKMFAALKASGNARSEYKIYPGTPHAFDADSQPSYRMEQAQDAWNRMLAWFKLNL